MLKMGLKKTHEHESGFFEENLLTTSESSKNRFKLTSATAATAVAPVTDEKMRNPQQVRDLSRGQTNMINSCNNVSETYDKLINTLNNCNYESNTIVIDSDDGSDDDANRFSVNVVGSATVSNGHCSSNPDPDIVDIADDEADESSQILESIPVCIGGNNMYDSGDDDEIIDIDHVPNSTKQHNQHISSQQTIQSKSSNTSSNNNKTQEKSKYGDTDAKSSIQLMQEIEEASTIRPQGNSCRVLCQTVNDFLIFTT